HLYSRPEAQVSQRRPRGEERSAAADQHLPAVRVGYRQPTLDIGVHADLTVARTEPPGLRVVQRRCVYRRLNDKAGDLRWRAGRGHLASRRPEDVHGCTPCSPHGYQYTRSWLRKSRYEGPGAVGTFV